MKFRCFSSLHSPIKYAANKYPCKYPIVSMKITRLKRKLNCTHRMRTVMCRLERCTDHLYPSVCADPPIFVIIIRWERVIGARQRLATIQNPRSRKISFDEVNTESKSNRTYVFCIWSTHQFGCCSRFKWNSIHTASDERENKIKTKCFATASFVR